MAMIMQVTLAGIADTFAQTPADSIQTANATDDTAVTVVQTVDDDTLHIEGADTLQLGYDDLMIDTLTLDLGNGSGKRMKRDWSTWRPSPKRAMWLALVLPGAGQIYNRKYWKLPIVYGGFVGCVYAMNWNNQMYRDYSQAYMDLMDNDPQTDSYKEFLHIGGTITESNKARYESLFKKRKDRFRRWRDLSFFCLVGVYAISVVDAYIDASLSEFDISDDLSLRVEPAVLSNPTVNNPVKGSALGFQCSINF